MALYLGPKPTSSVYLYTWAPSLADQDAIASATLSVSAGTATLASYEHDAEVVSFFLSGGALGENTVISASAVTREGETLTETLYVPIVSSAKALANTARDICNFALRRIVGRGETAQADELDDALEVLNAMLLDWRIDGMDLGLASLEANDTVLAADEYVTAIKYNLRVLLEGQYGAQSSTLDARMAERGKILIANRLLDIGSLGFAETNNTRRHAAYDGSY